MKAFEPAKHLLNHSEIDSTHQEFLDIYNSVDRSDPVLAEMEYCIKASTSKITLTRP